MPNDRRAISKRRSLHRWLPVLVALLAAGSALATPAPAHADGPKAAPWSAGRDLSRPQDLQIRFVTFSPGTSIPAWFGHSALVVEDTRLGVSRLYNYGMFNFDGTLLIKFATGRLTLWVGHQPEYATYEFYKSLNRDVRVHALDLPPHEREKIAEFLAWNVRPENREYLYHHYRDNCATRPRDILDEAVDGALHRATSEPARMSLRQHTRRHTYHNFPMDLLLMFMMNDNIDQPIHEWDAMFLPEELEKHVLDLEYEKSDGETVPLVSKSRVFYEADHRPIPEEPPPRWHWALLIGLFLGGVGAGSAWWWRRRSDRSAPRILLGVQQAVVGLVVGLPGLALYIMSMATNHTVTYWNENLFFANPLTFAALPLGVMLAWGRRWPLEWTRAIWVALVGLSILGIALKPVPGFDQQNLMPICFILPINVLCAAAAWLAAERTSR